MNMEGDSDMDITVICPEDVVIPVMGMTGVGKSSFIALCTQNSAIVMSHGLTSCTSRVSICTTEHAGRTIHLIDTPGFDDTGRTDADTLQEIAYWLSAAYENKIFISGLIYLHRVTDPRLQGAAFRSLNVFKRICGSENYCGVVLATTGWDDLKPGQTSLASSRHSSLCQNDQFWGDILKAGGQAVPLRAANIDAMRILDHIVGKNRKMTLAFQKQLMEESKPIHETDAGIYLYPVNSTLGRDEHSQFDKDMTRLQEQCVQSLSQRQVCLDDEGTGLAKLRMTSHDLRALWQQNINKHLQSLREETAINGEEYEKLKAQINSTRKLQPIEQRVQLIRQIFPPVTSLQTLPDIHPMPLASPASQHVVQERAEVTLARKERSGVTHRNSRLTALSFAGTGIAAAQLVAAMACTVM